MQPQNTPPMPEAIKQAIASIKGGAGRTNTRCLSGVSRNYVPRPSRTCNTASCHNRCSNVDSLSTDSIKSFSARISSRIMNHDGT